VVNGWTMGLLAGALSLDSLSVGLLYGARRIRLPAAATLIVAGASGLLLSLAMAGGSLLAGLLPPHLAGAVGGLLLMGVGLWIAWGALRPKACVEASEAAAEPFRRVLRLQLGSALVVIEILREPGRADLDRSGSISLWEAGLLGIALALDSVAAGLGAGLAGANWLLPVLACALSWLFLSAGGWVGARVPFKLEGRWGAVHGLVLLLLGLLRLLGS
jgi:putative sporulation protein YtaF